MPLIETKGAASAQGFGEFAASSGAVTYIENVFSTYLYTGTGGYQSITNNIDLAGKGGLVWIKTRNASTTNHQLFDTARGVYKTLLTNDIGPQQDVSPYGVYTFDSAGFTVGDTTNGGYQVNGSSPSRNYVSWTFRKQPKFFDVVTFNGNATARTIAHNLGSVPGCIMVKCITEATDWWVYHRSLGTNQVIKLNTTAAQDTSSTAWNNTAPTSTVFSIGDNGQVNSSGQTYVAYLFAHNAGGFGLTGTDNVISCGSYTGNGSATGPVITLGYEPQWVMVKRATVSTGSWEMYDSMRGFTMEADAVLRADTSGAEFSLQRINPTSTGFQLADSDGDVNANGSSYIYIAIRRGPMKVPTSGTSVFEPKTMSATQANLSITGVGFPPDLVINGVRSNANYGQQVTDRLRGVTKQVFTEYNSAENTTNGTAVVSLNMNGISLGADTAGTGWNAYSGYTSVKWMFGRAPSFFDEVCFTTVGGGIQTITHNLAVAPELVILKQRSGTSNWPTLYAAGSGQVFYLDLNWQANNGWSPSDVWTSSGSGYTAPTSTTMWLNNLNASQNYVTYLFASCAGVSKVGSYTGTGALQTINCGFAAGARFVLIKRTDSTGDWYTYDSARGITSGNDPYLLLNSAAAEVTGTNYVDTTSVGFQVTAAAPSGLNANGGTYIFLAIA